MSRKKDHGISPQVSPEQAGELFAPILSEILKADPEAIQRQIGRKKKFAAEFRSLLIGGKIPYSVLINAIVVEWERFYLKHFGMEVDFSDISIPEEIVSFERVLIIVQGLTLNQVFNVCAAKFPVRTYVEDLDCDILVNERDSKDGHYAIRVRDGVEADNEFASHSAEWIKEQGLTTETLLERLIHELKFFDETGRHLDVKNWTLCSGSRDSSGRVPSVFHYSGKLRVTWRNPQNDYPHLRARSVVC